MDFITYAQYQAIYGSTELTETAFNLLKYDAQRIMDNATTCVDGFHKLRVAFPEDEFDVEAIKMTCAKIIHYIHLIEEAGKLVSTGNGNHGTKINSVSSGSESISYDNSKSSIEQASQNITAKEQLLFSLVREGLSGTKDKNGVNLLYGGEYVFG